MAEVAVDTVRASKDGHQFHEAWLARRALGLLFPRDELCGIAVEGLSKDIGEDAETEAIEIADATFFYGSQPRFEKASKIDITQFKYSIARADVGIRFSDIKKTIQKFSTAESGFEKKYGREQTRRKFRYSCFTNRPVSADLAEAIATARAGREPQSEGAKSQYVQLCTAIPFKGDALTSFILRFEIIGSADNLGTIERGTARIIADWSASNDIMARARIGDLKDVIRRKAGSAGQQDNMIIKVDVLAPLGLAHESELLPTPEAFPDTGDAVERAQLGGFVAKLGSTGRWLIHAEGGIGKTVFAQSLLGRLSAADEVVLFDCFGGGAYRSPIDERHRPERGLMHIVNELACRGLCDPILPGSTEPSEVIRRAIERFSQVLTVLHRTRPTGRLVIIMDAADNAADEALKRNQPSFPKELLESLTYHAPIDGLVVIATARPEHRDIAIGKAECKEFEIVPFTLEETKVFVLARRPEATSAQIAALQRRSDGNPRVIANLIEPDRSLAGETQTTDKVNLDALIEDRIARAIKLADAKGAKGDAIDAFLCALGVLPPPIPVDEMAIAFGLSKQEVASLAADLSPLLERTRHGLIFRDEPTETLVKRKYGSKLNLLNDVVGRLRDAQAISVYAARALPLLLFAMGRVDDLRQLAFDKRFPPELESDVAKRAIRLVRVKTAVGAAAKARDFNATTDLLVELSSIALVNERGDVYLANNPDLVVAFADPESLRRLFEMRLGWPAERHSRLSIAYTTDGDLGDAYGHAVRADEWITWSYKQGEEPLRSHRAGVSEHVAIPFYLAVEGRERIAAGYIGSFNADFGFRLADGLFSLLTIARALGKYKGLPGCMGRLARCTKASPPLIAAALTCFPQIGDDDAKPMLQRLAKLQKQPVKSQAYVPREEDSFRASLLRCSLRACRLNLARETALILEQSSPRRYSFWSLTDPWPTTHLLPWLLAVSVKAVLDGKPLTLFDCLPAELWHLVENDAAPESMTAQQELLAAKLKETPAPKSGEKKKEEAKPGKPELSASERYHASDKIKSRVVPALDLGQIIMRLLQASTAADQKAATKQFFESWKTAQVVAKKDVWATQASGRYINDLYSACALQLFEAVSVINPDTANQLEECLGQCEFVSAPLWIQFITLLSAFPECHAHAGRAATAAVKVIELEDDVQHRSSLFARLARSILPANRTEAGLLFKRGLTELDAIGSGDYQFMNELLGFAASLKGGPVKPATALRLAKVCELNNYDSHKFPWPIAGKAFSRVWGIKYLAQIARWHDRDKADLELTLPAAITFLVRDGALEPIDGVLLLGLVEPVGMWDWGWHDLFDSLLDTTNDVSLFHAVLDHLERTYPTGSYRRHLTEIRTVLQRKPDALAALASRLDALEAGAAARREVDRSTRSSPSEPTDISESVRHREMSREDINTAVAKANPLHSASLEILIDKIDGFDGALTEKSKAFQQLRSRVPYGDRDKHIDAIVATRNLELFAKIELLKATKEAWIANSPSALASVNDLGSRLVSAHADELMGSDWGFNWELNKLAEVTGARRTDLAIDLVGAATSRGLRAAATTWLNVSSITSNAADEEVPRQAFERLLDDGAARLADEVGDGPWRDELDPGDDPAAVVAGLIWFCLGSPEAKARWRAAHVVRQCARMGRWNVIAKLFDILNGPNAGAFQDPKLPFFVLHAKLWLLLAIARIALDFPHEIERFATSLEAIALNDAFPHVGLRDAAIRALKACLGKSKAIAAKETLNRLDAIHKSKFPKPEKTQQVSGNQWDRPENKPKLEPKFNFEYDFEKYDINGVGRLFGMPQWEAGDRCVRWIRTMSPDTTSMYEFAGRRKRSGGSEGYKEGTDDRFHNYGTYLAWHSIQLTGGELFLDRPIARVESYEDSWEDWLSNYSITRTDGLWLSDGTDPYPERACHDLLDITSKDLRPTADFHVLLTLAGIENGKMLGETVLVSGSWKSPDGVHVDISSALVPSKYAELAALAVSTAPEHHMYLPRVRAYQDEDDDFGSSDNDPCQAWVGRREAYAKLDKFDPYGSEAAIERDRLTMTVIKQFSLSSTDLWSATWLRPGRKLAYTAEAWGMRLGDGRGEEAQEGVALVCDTKFLSDVLKRSGCSLVLLVKLELYIDKDRYGGNDSSSGKFAHTWATVTVSSSGYVKIIEPSAADWRTIKKLDQDLRYRFRDRFDALGKQDGR